MPSFKRPNKLVEKYFDDALRIANSFNSKFLLQDDKEGIALLALIRASRSYTKEAYKIKKIQLKNGKTKRVKTNEKVEVKFSTHLMNCIVNALRTSVNRSKKKGPIFSNRRVVKLDEVTEKRKFPKYELKYDDWDPHKIRSVHNNPHTFTIFDMLVAKDQGDPLILKEFIYLVRKRLNVNQNRILDFYADPSNLIKILVDQDKQKCLEILSDEEEIDEFLIERYQGFRGLSYKNMGRALRCTRQRVHQQLRNMRLVFKKVRKEHDSENFKLTKEEQGDLYG